tara:strand:+ start:469 stop:1086 length:618 start_codon:yes stop_codon:yes gene_type:complete
MLSNKEAQIGVTMARIAALGTVIIFGIQALLIGPDQVGYSSQYGAIVDVVSFVQIFGFLFTIQLTRKLFGEDNPYFRIVGAILFAAAVVQLTGTLSATANANSVFETVLSTDQTGAVSNVGQTVTFVLYGIWALCLISADERNLVPSWARISGQAAAYLVIAVQFGSLFGLVPAGAFVPVFILGGVILFPVFVFGLSVAFNTQGE